MDGKRSITNRTTRSLSARRRRRGVRRKVATVAISADLALIDGYDEQIAELERHLIKNAKVDDPVTFGLLRTVPGIGPILGLVLLYEIDTIARFSEVGNFLSYSRLVLCSHESAGKVKGSGGKKIGNAHLKWAFSEAACLMLRSSRLRLATKTPVETCDADGH